MLTVATPLGKLKKYLDICVFTLDSSNKKILQNYHEQDVENYILPSKKKHRENVSEKIDEILYCH